MFLQRLPALRFCRGGKMMKMRRRGLTLCIPLARHSRGRSHFPTAAVFKTPRSNFGRKIRHTMSPKPRKPPLSAQRQTRLHRKGNTDFFNSFFKTRKGNMKHLLVSKQRIATDASCGDIAASAKTQAKQMAERVIAKYPTIRYIGSVFTIAVVDIPETI